MSYTSIMLMKRGKDRQSSLEFWELICVLSYNLKPVLIYGSDPFNIQNMYIVIKFWNIYLLSFRDCTKLRLLLNIPWRKSRSIKLYKILQYSMSINTHAHAHIERVKVWKQTKRWQQAALLSPSKEHDKWKQTWIWFWGSTETLSSDDLTCVTGLFYGITAAMHVCSFYFLKRKQEISFTNLLQRKKWYDMVTC